MVIFQFAIRKRLPEGIGLMFTNFANELGPHGIHGTKNPSGASEQRKLRRCQSCSVARWGFTEQCCYGDLTKKHTVIFGDL